MLDSTLGYSFCLEPAIAANINHAVNDKCIHVLPTVIYCSGKMLVIVHCKKLLMYIVNKVF